MKAIRVNNFGQASELHLEEVPRPEVGPTDVLVRVHAIGVNPVDTYIRSGTYGPGFKVPYTPGFDAAGTVECAGGEVQEWACGDRVYIAGTQSGAYAELALCKKEQVHRLPDSISFAQGAALGVPYATAYYALVMRSGARLGETVLVHGATGGVGLAAVQFGAARGMTVIGTGGSAAGLQLLKDEGAHYVFDHRTPDYREELLAVNCGRGPDVILEMLANANLGHDLRMVAVRGRIAIIGSRGEVTINPRDAMSREATMLGVTLMKASDEDLKLIHSEIGKGLRDQTLRPIIHKDFPLHDAERAHEEIVTSSSLGKIVLTP